MLRIPCLAAAAALRLRKQTVNQRGIGERATNHDFVVTAPRGIKVQVLRILMVLNQPLSRQTRKRDRPGRRDVIGSDIIPNHMKGCAPERVSGAAGSRGRRSRYPGRRR